MSVEARRIQEPQQSRLEKPHRKAKTPHGLVDQVTQKARVIDFQQARRLEMARIRLKQIEEEIRNWLDNQQDTWHEYEEAMDECQRLSDVQKNQSWWERVAHRWGYDSVPQELSEWREIMDECAEGILECQQNVDRLEKQKMRTLLAIRQLGGT
ncbi:hypothetical protein FJZ48_00205 [Candidatus Uhrbacteria bacterium]|nr:hypothetical protein [Candidatus Uhrbacteria bacterium]